MANEFKQFMGLLIFGNIENLILSAQGATAHVDPFILGGVKFNLCSLLAFNRYFWY